MPRTRRVIINDETAVYHVMSRTALDGFPLGDVEKDFMLDLIRRLSALYFTEILGFCLMGNHFQILVRMFPEHKYTDEDIQKRYENFYGDASMFASGWIPYLREKLFSLSEFVKEIKQSFSRYYNKRHHRRGTLWGERFKSLIVENGKPVIKGTRIPISVILEQIAQGDSWDDLLKGYPELKKDDIKAALLYVRASLDNTEVKAANA